MSKKYIGETKPFQGKLITKSSIFRMPDCLERDHILAVRTMLIEEGFSPDEFRVGELPIEGVYYFERAVQELGVDYFSVVLTEEGELCPQYTTLECDERGYNTFLCSTIRESIDKHEC